MAAQGGGCRAGNHRFAEPAKLSLGGHLPSNVFYSLLKPLDLRSLNGRWGMPYPFPPAAPAITLPCRNAPGVFGRGRSGFVGQRGDHATYCKGGPQWCSFQQGEEAGRDQGRILPVEYAGAFTIKYSPPLVAATVIGRPATRPSSETYSLRSSCLYSFLLGFF